MSDAGSHPLGMLATGPVIGLSLGLTRLPFRVLKTVNNSITALRCRWPEARGHRIRRHRGTPSLAAEPTAGEVAGVG